MDSSTIVSSKKTISSLSCMVVLLGGKRSAYQWIMLAVSMVVCWAVGMQSDFTSTLVFARKANVKKTPIDSRSYRLTRCADPFSKISSMIYTYHVGKSEYSAKAYFTSYPEGENGKLWVEYLAGDPSISRMCGARRKFFGDAAFAFAILPIFPVILLIRGIRQRAYIINLTLSGATAIGYLRYDPASEDQEWGPLTYTFTTQDGSTRELVTDVSEYACEGLDEKTVVYNQNDPRDAIVPALYLDEGVWDNATSSIRDMSFFVVAKAALLPAIAVLIVLAPLAYPAILYGNKPTIKPYLPPTKEQVELWRRQRAEVERREKVKEDKFDKWAATVKQQYPDYIKDIYHYWYSDPLGSAYAVGVDVTHEYMKLNSGKQVAIARSIYETSTKALPAISHDANDGIVVHMQNGSTTVCDYPHREY